MPYKDFRMSARCLDKKRLFKQVVEARQILATNGITVYKNDGTTYKPSHRNHPCVKMWYGYDNALMQYHNEFLNVCLSKGIQTDIKHFDISGEIVLPPWMSDDRIYRSHKSNLLKKDHDFYGHYGWDVPTDIEYVWGYNDRYNDRSRT